MRVLTDGYEYELDHLDGGTKTVLLFVNREPGHECEGPTTQEVIRALIDRTLYCNHCLPSDLNFQAVYHLRMALALHEARHLIRATEKGMKIEHVAVDAGLQHLKMEWDDLPRKEYHTGSMADYVTATGGPNPGTPCYDKEDD